MNAAACWIVPLVVCTVTGVPVLAWINEYDQPAHYQCATGSFISHINSAHSNFYDDRVWDFGCSPIPADVPTQNCQWTNYVNDFDQPLTFHCPNDGYIAGMESMHDNGFEDRKFKFQCCEMDGAITHLCTFTGYENDFDGILDYYVPASQILTGISSYHDNFYEDRRFKFEICQVELKSHGVGLSN